MAQDANLVGVCLEVGQKRTFAVALDWPGWARSGRDEAAALLALLDYGPRYARVVKGSQRGFHAPSSVSNFVVAERVTGDATTDFGAPGIILARDAQPVEPGELERLQAVLGACWRAFDAAVQAATGKELRKGPRGGGRDLAKIVQHVRDVDAAYLRSLGGEVEQSKEDTPDDADTRVRTAIHAALAASVRGEIPARGPRGGERWPARYFVRRLAWHVLDHAWEIDDRIEQEEVSK